jgi:predicted nucleic acid-binding protein
MAATEPPTPPPAVLYLDTSALLKLLVREAESAAIERELLTWRELATSVAMASAAIISRSNVCLLRR